MFRRVEFKVKVFCARLADRLKAQGGDKEELSVVPGLTGAHGRICARLNLKCESAACEL